jgi:hypothetical protein
MGDEISLSRDGSKDQQKGRDIMDDILWPAIPRWRVETQCADADRWRPPKSYVLHRPPPRSLSLTRRSLRTWLQRHLGAHESRETSNGLL